MMNQRLSDERIALNAHSRALSNPITAALANEAMARGRERDAAQALARETAAGAADEMRKRLDAEARIAELEAMVARLREALQTVVDETPFCTCVADYTSRGLVAPDCFYHQMNIAWEAARAALEVSLEAATTAGQGGDAEVPLRVTLFQQGSFTLHSGSQSTFKIDCDALTDDDWKALAAEAAKRLSPFGIAEGVPTGGLRFADALQAHRSEGCERVLVVDDVLTTGRSMEEMREKFSLDKTIGVVAFARGPVPDWVTALFTAGQGGDAEVQVKQAPTKSPQMGWIGQGDDRMSAGGDWR
jgi:hypothetical protein